MDATRALPHVGVLPQGTQHACINRRLHLLLRQAPWLLVNMERPRQLLGFRSRVR